MTLGPEGPEVNGDLKKDCVTSFARSIVGTQVKGLTHTYGPTRNFIPHVRQTRQLQVAAHIPYQIW